MKTTSSKKKGGFVANLKERWRKLLVAIKKNPQAFPLLSLCAAFLVFSLNLTNISNTTAKIQGQNMGLCAFVSMLFMMLSFVCMLNAFPKRQKPKIPMIILMLVLYGIIIFADIVYLGRVDYALALYGSAYSELDIYYIYTAYNAILINIIIIGVTIALVLLEPVIAKLLKKIKTSVEVEGSGDFTAIDIADED